MTYMYMYYTCLYEACSAPGNISPHHTHHVAIMYRSIIHFYNYMHSFTWQLDRLSYACGLWFFLEERKLIVSEGSNTMCTSCHT